MPHKKKKCGALLLFNVIFFYSSCNIKFYEGPTNLNWTRILSTIREDIDKFYKEDGMLFPDSLVTNWEPEEVGGICCKIRPLSALWCLLGLVVLLLIQF